MLRRLVLAALVSCLTVGFAAASGRAPNTAEQASLQAAADAFAQATEENDVAALVDALPPRVLQDVSEANMIAPDQVREMLIEAARGFGAAAAPQGVSADISGVELHDVRDRRAGGTLSWGLIDLSGSAQAGTARRAFEAEMIALLEGGDWYFARVDLTGQVGLIRQSYPELRGLPNAR